jgi:hypothetical protein
MIGERKNSGKLRWRNFPLFLIRPVVEVADAAEKRPDNPKGKYETFNFLKGLSALDTMDSLMRHADKFMDPTQSDYDEVDDNGKPGTGKHHLALIAWNALVLLYHVTTRPELDDRWKGHKND